MVDISYTAPHYQRYRYQKTITMKSGDPDLRAGPMAKPEDFKKTTKKQGKVNSFIPKERRTRHGRSRTQSSKSDGSV